MKISSENNQIFSDDKLTIDRSILVEKHRGKKNSFFFNISANWVYSAFRS